MQPNDRVLNNKGLSCIIMLRQVKCDSKMMQNFPGYTQDYLYAHAKRFYPEFTATASIKPKYASVLKYGHQLFDSAIVQVQYYLTKRNIRRNFSRIKPNLEYTPRTPMCLNCNMLQVFNISSL